MPGAQHIPPSEEVPWLRARVAELKADNEVMAAQLAARDAQPEAVQQDLFPERETLYATQYRAKRLVTGLLPGSA